jgi:hypothetical protein
VGIPRGLSLSEFDFGIQTLLILSALYLVNGLNNTVLSSLIALYFSAGLDHIIPSTPGVLPPSLEVIFLTARALASKDNISFFCSL